jgi:hypothetical protein
MTHFAQGWDPALTGPIADAGIRSVRDEVYWQDIEPERGRFEFPARYEHYMEALRQRGIAPLVELTFANKAYDGGLTPYTDGGLAAYARYGVEVLRHYGTQIGAVEIWNEYNGSFCRGPAAADRAGTYARMARAAYAEIKRERSDVLVAGASTAGVPLPYLERLFSLGALESMDAVSIHPYRYDSEPEGIEDDVAALQQLIRRYNHGKPKPIWVTEIGWGTKSAATGLEIDEAVQASFLVRAYALLLSAGVERIYWYLFCDTGAFATMGLVHGGASHTPKESYRAMQVMITEIGNARFVRREATPDDLYSLLFERGPGEEIRIVWSLRPRTLVVPPACSVTAMLGGAAAPDGPLTLGGEPFYIEGPMSGLPAPGPDAPSAIADSERDFSGSQGAGGWSYGAFVGGGASFVPLEQFRVTDWKREWFARFPYLSISDREQHPSESAAGPVAAVRRWTATGACRVRICARFRCGARGDGVRVAIYVEGRELHSMPIGGPFPREARFDFEQALVPAGPVDFAVFPGPHGNSDFDATETGVTISGRQP